MLSDDVITQLKSVDPDRYRAALFAPVRARQRLWGLYAFHYELAKVPEWVSEPMLGEIRYQWWRDAVSEIYGGGNVRAHEISTPLKTIIEEVDMPRFWVDRLIHARARDLDPTPFGTLQSARDYCQQTSGTLMVMAVHCLLDGDMTQNHENAALQAGEAWGLTGLLRGWGYYHDSILDGLVFDEVCAAATQAHAQASLAVAGLPESVFPAMAYAALIPKYLTRLKRKDHDPLSRVVRYAPLLKQMRLMGAVMRGRI